MKVTQEEILQMNILYKELGTYAAVSREIGRAPSTVKKYIDPTFEIVDESELEDSYIDADEDLDEEGLFNSTLNDDADDLMIFDNDLAEDNILNKQDIIDDEGGEF